ncbi:hypothetical protein [Wenxinia marina]|uniref:Lipoprotein n=1 Tax=Wenxinia marina DSM 24838 TaxID=1123501 RepID=A0A0D0Q617_9RHOB|nr:hypothetical protein [Wenxinia marina]KIQ69914.1 hypothetical protein Wenmar_01484 [Wenxinia marina DSM 24838]GGL62174.1 hypothetical protein GCM10011392_15870 [Wenxinia marina]
MRPFLVLALLALAACAETVPPPGTVVAEEEVEGGTLVTTTSGGPQGMEVIRTFVPGPPEGGWPVMGTMRARLDGRPFEWTTFDFSVGAFDATAWLQRVDGAIQLSLRGLPDGDPEADRGWLFVRGTLPSLAPGETTAAVVALTKEDSIVGPRWQSLPGAATLVLETLERDGDEVYGHATGRYAATVCPTDGEAIAFDETDCRRVEGTFDTEIQFDSL